MAEASAPTPPIVQPHLPALPRSRFSHTDIPMLASSFSTILAVLNAVQDRRRTVAPNAVLSEPSRTSKCWWRRTLGSLKRVIQAVAEPVVVMFVVLTIEGRGSWHYADTALRFCKCMFC